MNNSLKILSWNANGLLKRQLELQAVLDLKNIDVCLISETHLVKQSLIKIKGYKFYHTTHPGNSAKGGSAVIIKENIAHYELQKYQTEEIQATSVSVQTKHNSIVVAGIYCPPRHSLKLEQYITFFKSLGERFIVGGDYNAKNKAWGSRLTSPKGKQLLLSIEQLKCEYISTGKPTYWPTDPNKIPDLIDFFVYKNITCNFLYIDEIHELNSDHTAIGLTLSEHIIQKENNPALTNYYTDWENFRINLEEKINLTVPIKSKFQIDFEVEKLNSDIQQAAYENTPVRKTKLKGNNYPAEIREILREKRKARKKWHQSRNPQDKNKLNNLSQHLRREIRELKNKSLEVFLQDLTNDKSSDYSLWKATKNLKRPILQIPPLKGENGKWSRSNSEKASAFAAHLKKIFSQESSESDDHLEDITPENGDKIKHTTLAEVISEIKNIKPKKSPGFDLINGDIVKQMPRKAIIKLTNIINAAFRLKYVPALWKVAEVIMISKPGKPPHELSSYRPISLLPIMSKIFEKLLLKRLKLIIDHKKLIPDHQFGFRDQHSTIDQVHRITNVIENALENKKVCSAVFLDVAQAFDKVWHKGLIHKLKLSLPKPYCEILESYLYERFFRVKQEDAYSCLMEIEAGVPQGSVLGPVLYLLYTSDIPTTENNTIATFADDTVSMAVGENYDDSIAQAQKAISEIGSWASKWKIKLNESKSVHVDFTNKKLHHKHLYINNQIIPHANTAKYLGMTLDAKLRWKPHVKKKREELGLKYQKMYWLIGKNSTLSIYNKILLYKQILKPVWTYGIQLWGCTKPSNIQIIQNFQNKVLRNIVNAPWYIRNSDIHRDLKIEDVASEIKKFARSHEQRLHHHVNVEAIQLLDTTDITRRLKRTKPFELT